MNAIKLALSILLLLPWRLFGAGADAASVQNAIDSAEPGATIAIPAGTHDWSKGISIKKYVKLTGAGPGETTIRNDTSKSDGDATLICVTPSSSGSIEISNLRFVKGKTVGKHLVVAPGNGAPIIVHDCYFGWSGSGRSIEWQTNGGLIYNCEFVSEDKADNSGIAFKNPGSDSAWREASTLGDKDKDGTKNTYVEDCTFKDIYLQAFDWDDNSRAVIRYCTFDNSGGTSHGQDTSPVGLRQFELYNNTFLFALGGNCNPNPYPLNINYWFYVRGGTGVIWGNDMPRISSCAWGNKASFWLTVFNIRRKSRFLPCQTEYPAARQVGFGSNAQGRQISDPIYIWDNLGGGGDVSLVDDSVDQCGNRQTVTDYVKANRDYFIGQAKPGYKPFEYPHPLRLAASQVTP